MWNSNFNAKQLIQMKITYKEVKKIDNKIKAKIVELRITEDPLNAYYTIMASERVRQRDLNEINTELKDLLSIRYLKLETLQIQIEKEKAKTSFQERNLVLKISKKV